MKTRSHLVHPSTVQRHIEEVLANGDPEFARYIVRWCAWVVQNAGKLGSDCLLMPDSGQLALLLAQKLNFALTKLIRGSLQLTSEPGFPARSGNLPSRH